MFERRQRNSPRGQSDPNASPETIAEERGDTCPFCKHLIRGGTLIKLDSATKQWGHGPCVTARRP
jgi:hypothetical protein